MEFRETKREYKREDKKEFTHSMWERHISKCLFAEISELFYFVKVKVSYRIGVHSGHIKGKNFNTYHW